VIGGLLTKSIYPAMGENHHISSPAPRLVEVNRVIEDESIDFEAM
jgi:hypothetical protein